MFPWKLILNSLVFVIHYNIHFPSNLRCSHPVPTQHRNAIFLDTAKYLQAQIATSRIANLLLRSAFSWNFSLFIFEFCACVYLNLDKIQGKTWCYCLTRSMVYILWRSHLFEKLLWWWTIQQLSLFVSWQCTQNPNYSNSTAWNICSVRRNYF